MEELRRRRLARLDVPTTCEAASPTGEQSAATPAVAAVEQAAAALQPRVATPVPVRAPPGQASVDDEERTCRICHGVGGLLFAPCRCRGTAQLVHVSCLAAWREVSTGTASFRACEVCGCVYTTRVESWAWVLESRVVLACVAVSLLLASVFLTGCLTELLGLNLPQRFYAACRWTPPWMHHWWTGLPFWLGRLLRREAQSCNNLVAGCIAVGVGGTVRAAWRSYREDARFFWRQAVPSILVTCASSGTSALRLFVCGGLVFGGVAVASDLKLYARKLLLRFGERVLPHN